MCDDVDNVTAVVDARMMMANVRDARLLQHRHHAFGKDARRPLP